MDHRFQVALNGKKKYGYGTYHSGFSLFDSLWIKNETEYAFSDLSIHIVTEPNVLLQGSIPLEYLPEKGYRAYSCDFIRLDLSFFVSLKSVTQVSVSVEFLTVENKLVDVHEFSFQALPFDWFPGLEVTPESLAFFVTPDQTEVKRIANSLQSDGLYGFCKAAYDFIKLRKITFSADDHSPTKPHPIRLPEQIFSDNRAGALDLALLYASISESAGYVPVIYVTGKGKAYVRVSTGKKSRPIASYAYSEEIDLSDDVLLDGSYFGYGSELNFENAVLQSKKSLSFFDGRIQVIDIGAARRMRVRPLPNRVQEGGSYVLSEYLDEPGERFSDYVGLVKKNSGNERIMSFLTANKIPIRTKKLKYQFNPALDVNQNKILQKILRDDFTLIRAQHGTGMTTLFTVAASSYLKDGNRVLYLSDKRDGKGDFARLSARFFDPAFVLDLTGKDVPAVDHEFKGIFTNHDALYERSTEVSKALREIDQYYETLDGGKRIVSSFLLASERYTQLRSGQEGIVFSPEQIGQLSDEMVKMWFSTISEIDQTLKETGPVNTHPLRLVRQPLFSYEYKSKLIELLESVIQDLSDVVFARDTIRGSFSDPGLFSSRSQIDALVELIRLFSTRDSFPVQLFADPEEIDEYFRRITDLIHTKKENDDISSTVFLSFDQSVIDLDAEDLLEQWYGGAAEKGLRGISKRHSIVKTVKKYLKPNFDIENVELILTKLVTFRKNLSFIEEEQRVLFDLLRIDPGSENAWNEFSALNDLSFQVYNVYLTAFDKERIGTFILELDKSVESSNEALVQCRKAYQSFRKHKNALDDAVCNTVDSFYKDLCSDASDYWLGLKEVLNDVLSQIDGLRAWCDWLSVSGKANEIGMKNVVLAMETGRVDVQNLKRAFLRSFFKGVCEYNFMVSPEIAPDQFDFEERYRLIDRSSAALLEEKKGELDGMLSVNKIDALSGVSGKTEPLEILRTDKDRFSALYPCVISDIDTARKLFGELDEFFDLVLIEDRRSVPIRDLLWVLRTGKNVAYAGDFYLNPKNDEQGFDLTDPAFDAFWNATDVHCSASCVYGRSPAMNTLLGNALSAFRHDARCYGVPQTSPEQCSEWIQLNGFYDDEVPGANLQEAKYIVDAIVRFCLDASDESLSVVCATVRQKELILQLLSQKMRRQADLASLLDKLESRLFVTSVNEEIPFADTVYFSCTYAPDRSLPGCKLPSDYFRFGSPDAKRTVLDVLSSAAKHITFVASFGISELDHVETLFSVTDAFTVVYRLCSVGKVNNGYYIAKDQFPTNAILALDKMIRDKGYRTVLNVQNGRFFLDLVVLGEDGFQLGVISDQTVLSQKSGIGAIEYSNRKLFSENGWRIYRLRSSNTVDSLEREADRICSLLDREQVADTEMV